MQNGSEKTKKSYLADIIVISAIVLITLLFLLFSFAFKSEGAYVTVEVDGVKTGEYSLSKNATYTLNGGTNVLVIENGVAYLSYSNCPDHTCENTGKIRYVGQSIICLPNRVTVTVRGDTDGGVDLVS